MKQSTNKRVKCNLQYGTALIDRVSLYLNKNPTKFDFSIEGTILLGTLDMWTGVGRVISHYKHTHHREVKYP